MRGIVNSKRKLCKRLIGSYESFTKDPVNQFDLQRENSRANEIALNQRSDLLINRTSVAYDSVIRYLQNLFPKRECTRYSRGGRRFRRNNSSDCSDCRVFCMRNVQLESSMLLEA